MDEKKKMPMNSVAVLMSTYNGNSGGFICQQLDSILNQKDVDLSLYIRDDKSDDDTVAIIKKYMERYANITLIEAEKNLGACRSFLQLISTKIDAEFFALADQDDIWDEDKLAIGIRKLKELPQDKPALYFSNVRVVDQNNNFLRLAHSEPQIAKNKYSFLAEPLPSGCTCVYNRTLAEMAWELQPESFSMHDTWLYTAAAMFGNVVYDFEPHMNYRQHSNNVSGTAKKLLSFEGVKRQLNNYLNRKAQPRYGNAVIIRNQWSNLMDSEQKEMVDLIADYKNNIHNWMRLFLCNELLPGNKYRCFRWRMKILLRNI